MRRLGSIVIAVVAVATAGLADTAAERRPVAAGAAVTVALDRGEVSVVGIDRAVLEMESDVPLAVDGDRDAVTVAPAPGHAGRAAVIELRVPRGCELEVRTVTAEIWVDRFEGDLTVRTVAGPVRIDGTPRRVQVEGVSGDLVLDVPTDEAQIAWENGDVDVRGVRRSLRCEVTRGDVAIATDRRLADLTCRVISGDVAIAGPVPADADWTVDTQMGDVIVQLAEPADAQLEVTTAVGSIVSDLVDRTDHRSEVPGPQESRTLIAGDGQGRVRVTVLTGDVIVRR
ncbi:DUF4097 family beta strand repeat protein [bacterium]|nr:DUF4097 family beta strand repeat protein [bacterium]